MFKSRRVGRVGHVAGVREMRNVYKILVRKLEGTDRSEDLGVDGKVMELTDIGCKVVEWSHLAQDRNQWWVLVNTVMKLRNFLTS
jgi:hypothetical protein